MKLPQIRFEGKDLLGKLILPSGKLRISKDRVRQIDKKILRCCKAWKRYEYRILKGICEILDLKFDHSVIDVIVDPCWPEGESSPIIVSSKLPADQFIDVLTHELLHALFHNNRKKLNTDKIWDVMFPTAWPRLTKIHVLVHAAHQYIMIDVLKDSRRITREIKTMRNHPDYRTSWEYVQKEGYLKIIARFKKFYRLKGYRFSRYPNPRL